MNVSKFLVAGLAALCASTSVSWSALDISNGSPLTENFNTLEDTSATGSTLPTGWAIAENGATGGLTYGVNNGSSTTGNTYSYGTAGSSERALGGLFSGSLLPSFGLEIRNQTGSTITELLISYVGEQWRLGTLGRVDRLDFQFSTDATSLITGQWSDFDSLDFLAPTTTGAVGALNGNVAPNRTSKSDTLSGLAFLNGQTMWLRWSDLNATSSDDGLAIDDFSIAATIAVPEPSTFIAGALLALPFGVQGIRYLRNRKRA